MKIINFKTVLGLAALGAVAYARKHGGFQAALQDLLAKKDQLLAKKDELLAKHDEPVAKPASTFAEEADVSSFSPAIPSATKPFPTF